MTQSSIRTGLLAATVALAIVVAATVLTGNLTAQAQDPEDAALVVGTYDPQAAFEQHPAQGRLMESMAAVQAAMQQAQQEGDQQRMQQLQQEFEQQRSQAVDEFHRDVDVAVAEAAEDAGVKVVAERVVYTDDDVQTRDITAQVVAAFAPDDGGLPEPASPGFQQVPGQPQ